MADADLSSYPKPALPVSPLETAGQIGGLLQRQQSLQQGAINIDQSKLDLYNKHFQIMNNELANLANKPDTTKEEVLTRMHRIGDTFNMPDAVRKQMDEEFANVPNGVPLASNPILAKTLDLVFQRGLDFNQKLNAQYGANGTVQDNATITPSKTYLRGGPVPSGAPIAIQPTPTLPTIGPDKVPTIYGQQPPAIPPNSIPVQGGFPAQFQPASALPVQPPPRAAITPPANPAFATPAPAIKNQDRAPVGNPSTPVTGFAPGVKEAADIAGQASGTQLANARTSASHFQRDIYPLMQAIPALEKLGTKGTGPGTETINQLKSFILSNVPGVKESDFNGTVKDFDEARKYLTDFVNQTGSSGTNDKLAAAFAGNPNVHISNAAAVDVAKAAFSLRLMQQAQYLEFENTGLPENEFSKWVAKRNNEYDPRAFGVNMMTPDAQIKLKKQLLKSPLERKRFEDTLALAEKFGFIAPPKVNNKSNTTPSLTPSNVPTNQELPL